MTENRVLQEFRRIHQATGNPIHTDALLFTSDIFDGLHGFDEEVEKALAVTVRLSTFRAGEGI